ncbi:MAG: DUF1273 family protein [Ruminococcus sp.]|nr:DUF1273 family protein [Ruminococcus sp.]
MLYSLNSGMSLCPSYEVMTDTGKTVCISGHRDKSIVPYVSDNSDATVFAVRKMLFSFIDIAVKRGFDTFISGLAEGTDLQAADYICRIKRAENLRLIGAIPFLKHSLAFTPEYSDMLETVEKNADILTVINDEAQMTYGKEKTWFSSPTVYRERNYFMVDKSSEVIAFLNENNFRSGTYQTVRYAMRRGRKVHRFGIKDIYGILERTGTDKERITDEINRTCGYLYDIP